MKLRTSGDRNAVLYEQRYKRIKNELILLACTMFEWENLPPHIDKTYIELSLIKHGKILFFEYNGVLCVSKAYELNRIGDLKGTRYSINSAEQIENVTETQFTKENSVMVYNNQHGQNLMNTIDEYAIRLAQIEQAEMQNVNLQNVPVMLEYNQENKRDVLEFHNQMLQGANFVFVRKRSNKLSVTNSDVDSLSAKKLDINPKFIANDLAKYKQTTINSFLTVIGLNNANNEKKERLLVDEVNSNNEVTDLYRHSMLSEREIGVAKANEMFKKNIKVRFRLDVPVKEMEEVVNDVAENNNQPDS